MRLSKLLLRSPRAEPTVRGLILPVAHVCQKKKRKEKEKESVKSASSAIKKRDGNAGRRTGVPAVAVRVLRPHLAVDEPEGVDVAREVSETGRARRASFEDRTCAVDGGGAATAQSDRKR